MYDQAQSSRLGQAVPLENPGIQLLTSVTLPANAYNGQTVYCLDIDEFRVYDTVSGSWQVPTASASGGVQVFVSEDEAVADHYGDFWLRPSNGQLYVWTAGSPDEWKQVKDSQAALDASSALSIAGIKSTIYYWNVEPTSPDFPSVSEGDYWLNTVNNRLYILHPGSEPTEIMDTDLVAAVNQAGRAESLADAKIQSYTTTWADRPLGLGTDGIGDLLYVTDQSNKVYRWNGADWVDLTQAEIDSQTFTGTLSVAGGAVAHVQNNAKVLLDGNSPHPQSAPSVVHYWPRYEWQILSPLSASIIEVTGIEVDGTDLYACVNYYNATRTSVQSIVYQWDYSTPNSLEVNSWSFDFSGAYATQDITMSGTFFYIIQKNLTTGSVIIRRGTKSTMALDGTTRTVSAYPTIGIDFNGTLLHHARVLPTGYWEVVRYNSNLTVNSTWDSTTQKVTYNGIGLYQANPANGISGNKFIINISGTAGSPAKKFCSFTPDSDLAPRVTAEDWQPADPQNTGGFTYDGTFFIQAQPTLTGAGNLDVYLYTNDTWTDTPHDTRWASTAFRRRVSGSEVYRSVEGPRVAFTGIKRASLQLVGPSIPDAGGSNDPNAMAFYMGHGSSVSTSTMYLQTQSGSEPAVGLRLMYWDIITGPPNVDSGTNPITTTTFPVAVPGELVSSELRLDGTPKNYIDGLGASNLDGLIPPGTILLYGATTAPAGWKLCDGTAISRTTYPDLFFVIGTTFGVGDGSTTFNLPNLTPPTSTKYIIKL